MLELRNPHSILATLRARPKGVRVIHLPVADAGGVWSDVFQEATRHGISVVPGGAPVGGAARRSSGRNTERSGGGMAMIEPPSPIALQSLWKSGEKSDDCGIWLALDQVQDPQNMGALFRLAGFFGVRGVVLTRDRSASINATVCDVATGGTEVVPFSVVANLAQAIDDARQHNLWILGTCERSDRSIYGIQRDRHWLLVVGNEGRGLRRLTREKCDQLAALPAHGPVSSLNVASATAACLAVLTSPRSATNGQL